MFQSRCAITSSHKLLTSCIVGLLFQLTRCIFCKLKPCPTKRSLGTKFTSCDIYSEEHKGKKRIPYKINPVQFVIDAVNVLIVYGNWCAMCIKPIYNDVCVYIYIHTCHIIVYVYIHIISLCICIYIYMYTYIYIYIHVCVSVSMCLSICLSVCLSIYLSIYLSN